MKQQSLFSEDKSSRKAHDGSLLVGRRRRRRPMQIKTPLHLVLRSDFAYGSRSLLRHRPLIERIIVKAQRRFAVKIYQKAIVSNHIHLLVKGESRELLQNFFRVVAGHIAQEILREFPIQIGEKPKASRSVPEGREKSNKFWQTRVYSRIVTWGREFRAVANYVIDNTLEALGLKPYRRKSGAVPTLASKNPRARIDTS